MSSTNHLLEVYASQYAELQRYAYSVVLSRALAEELVQDLCIKILSNPEQFADARNPIAYYKTCIANAAMTLLKRESKVLPLKHENITYRKRKEAFETSIDMDLTVDLERILDSFTDEEIQLIEWLYIYGYKVKEVAAIKGISSNAVSQQLFRVKAKLRKELKREQILFITLLFFLCHQLQEAGRLT